MSRERLCSLESYRSGTASAHVCPERIDIWMSATRKKWGKKHRKGNIFRASNMSVVDFDFSPVSGPRKVITPARCSITDQAGSPSLSPSLSLFLSPSREEPIITSYRFSVEIFADSPSAELTNSTGIFPSPTCCRRISFVAETNPRGK